MSIKFPLTISTFGDKEEMAVKKVIRTKNFTMGENIRIFENFCSQKKSGFKERNFALRRSWKLKF